jgi:two-component system cell cycle response regulator
MQFDAGSCQVIDELIDHQRPFGVKTDTSEPITSGILDAFHLGAAVAVPVVHAQELHGMLVAGREANAREFSEEDLALLTSIASQAGLALANVSAIKQLTEQAVTDGLTELYNPRYLREFLTQQLARSKRTRERTAVLMLDLDNFKEINDLLGHPTGDRVLMAVASTIRSCVRAADSVARYGGDEFAVVLPGASRRQAERVAQRILRKVREVYIEGENSPVGVTISAGVAMAAEADDARSLIQAADVALYAAKAAGRNCVR